MNTTRSTARASAAGDAGTLPSQTPPAATDSERVPTPDVEALQAEVQRLQEAMASRAVIDQAKGMLMVCYGISGDSAFELLSVWSQHENVKVRAIAAAMVTEAAHGELGKVLTHPLPANLTSSATVEP